MHLHTDGEGQTQGVSKNNDSWGLAWSPFLFHLVEKFVSRHHNTNAVTQPYSLFFVFIVRNQNKEKKQEDEENMQFDKQHECI